MTYVSRLNHKLAWLAFSPRGPLIIFWLLYFGSPFCRMKIICFYIQGVKWRKAKGNQNLVGNNSLATAFRKAWCFILSPPILFHQWITQTGKNCSISSIAWISPILSSCIFINKYNGFISRWSRCIFVRFFYFIGLIQLCLPLSHGSMT